MNLLDKAADTCRRLIYDDWELVENKINDDTT